MSQEKCNFFLNYNNDLDAATNDLKKRIRHRKQLSASLGLAYNTKSQAAATAIVVNRERVHVTRGRSPTLIGFHDQFDSIRISWPAAGFSCIVLCVHVLLRIFHVF